MSTTSINQWLPCTSTKHKIGHHLAHVSLEHFKGKAVSVVEMCDTDYQATEAHQGTLSRGGRYTRSSARHSEHTSYMRRASGHLGLTLLTLSWDKNWDSHSLVKGYPSFYPRIALVAPSPDRHRRPNSSIHGLGWSRQKDLKTWRLDSLLSIEENDQILDTFGHFEEGSISTSTVDGWKTLSVMPVSVSTLDTYLCKVYAPETLSSQVAMIYEFYTSLPR